MKQLIVTKIDLQRPAQKRDAIFICFVNGNVDLIHLKLNTEKVDLSTKKYPLHINAAGKFILTTPFVMAYNSKMKGMIF